MPVAHSEAGAVPIIVGAQLLRLVGAQGLVQTFEFLSVSAQPGRRANGGAVLAAHCAVRRHAADVPGDGRALGKRRSAAERSRQRDDDGDSDIVSPDRRDERKGLVTRSPLEDNGRTVAINLTAKGKTLVEELIPIAVHFADVAVSNYREEEVARLKTILREIYESLGSIEPEIEAARASAKPKRKSPSRRAASVIVIPIPAEGASSQPLSSRRMFEVAPRPFCEQRVGPCTPKPVSSAQIGLLPSASQHETCMENAGPGP